MKLNQLRENPNNPSQATDEQIERLAGKLKRVPLGLTAIRIAYVTDDKDGGKMVISGNKRLRVLKKMYGDDAELPDEYFQDVTAMSEAERHEFIVSANVSDGEWDLDKLLEQYSTPELNDLIGEDEVNQMLLQVAKDTYEEKYKNEYNATLSDRYVAPPFSVLHAYKGEWQKRKKAWKKLINDNGESRQFTLARSSNFISPCSSTNMVSILDPVLAEVVTSWYAPSNGKVFDCFAGDSVFGCVATKLGNAFTGIEIRKEQADLNNERVKLFGDKSIYICDDGQNVLKHISEKSQDLLFSCPPYFNLEKYSDIPNDASNQGSYGEFLKILENAFTDAVKCLKDDRFAVIVVGDVRDKKTGLYYDFIGDIKRIFRNAGMGLYNDIIYHECINTARFRCNRQMVTRKTVKVHQNVLVFYKGDTSKIKENFPPIDYSKSELNELFADYLSDDENQENTEEENYDCENME